MRTRSQQHGFTLMELMATLAIITILAAIAYPSFTDMIERNRLKGAAEGLFGDMEFAKSEAIKRNEVITVTTTTGGSWGYNIARPDTTVLKSVGVGDFRGVTLFSANNGGTLTIDPVRGTTSGISIKFVRDSDTNQSLCLVVSDLGRIKICSGNASSSVVGYKPCQVASCQ